MFSVKQKFLFLFADVLVLFLSFNFYYWIVHGVIHSQLMLMPSFGLVAGIVGFVQYTLDLYTVRSELISWRIEVRFLMAAAVASVLVAVAVYLDLIARTEGTASRWILGLSMLTYAVLAGALRIATLKWQSRQSNRPRWLFVGHRGYLRHLMSELQARNLDWDVVVSTTPERERGAVPVAGEYIHSTALKDLLAQEWTGVIYAIEANVPQTIIEHLVQARMAGNRIYSLADFYEKYWSKVPVFYVQNNWLITSEGFSLLHSLNQRRIKYILDKVFAALILVATIPILCVAACLILSDSGRPVIYKQVRTGAGQRQFLLYKLRTMNQDAEKDGIRWAAQNDPRVTRIGRLLRLTRIDELPQLVNVLKGDMSFIGPRPERLVFVNRIIEKIPFYRLRHLVRPGITGWAQVLYPYGSSIEDAMEKLQFDLYYIKNYSLMLDLGIMLRTVRVILLGRGR